MIKYIYSVFLGLLLAIFVGIGISVFYQQPKAPDFPSELNYAKTELTTEQQKVQSAFDTKQKAWELKMETYNRNVSIIALCFAVVLVAISLALGDRARVIADGVLIGGVLTLVYSLGRGFASNNTKYSFLIVGIALATAIFLGYIKFIKPHEQRLEAKIP